MQAAIVWRFESEVLEFPAETWETEQQSDITQS